MRIELSNSGMFEGNHHPAGFLYTLAFLVFLGTYERQA